MATNKPTYHLAPTADRAEDGPNSPSWTTGMNYGGSNANVLGAGTGEYDPKASDWDQNQRLLQESQCIGGTSADVLAIDGADINEKISFVETTAAVAPDALLRTGTAAFNKTGVTVPSGSWAWGLVSIA